MKRFMPIVTFSLLLLSFAFTLPMPDSKDDMDTVRLRRTTSIKVSDTQFRALKSHKRMGKVLNFDHENKVSAKRGYALLRARNKSFLVWPTGLTGKTSTESAVHVEKAKGGKGFTLQSASDFFTGAPGGTGVMLACYCKEGAGTCASFTRDGPDACEGDCCGLHADLITLGGEMLEEVLAG